jgi:hypothetical protein
MVWYVENLLCSIRVVLCTSLSLVTLLKILQSDILYVNIFVLCAQSIDVSLVQLAVPLLVLYKDVLWSILDLVRHHSSSI